MSPRPLGNRKRKSRQQLIAAPAKITYRTTDINPHPFLVGSVYHTNNARIPPQWPRRDPGLGGARLGYFARSLLEFLKQSNADEAMRFTYTMVGNRVAALTIEPPSFTHQDGTVPPP